MTTWVHRGYVDHHIADDPPMQAAMLDHLRDVANQQAQRQGLALVGEPRVTQQESVVVPDWDEHGDGIVAPEVARTAGLNPDELRRGPTLVAMHWDLLS